MAGEPTTVGLRLDYTARGEAATHRTRQESKTYDGARARGGERLVSPNQISEKKSLTKWDVNTHESGCNSVL